MADPSDSGPRLALGRGNVLPGPVAVALICFSAASLATACGARTEPAAPHAAGAPDAAVPVDGGPRPRLDAGRADAGSPDAGRSATCERDVDCRGAGRCVADAGRVGVDLEPVPLVCGLMDGLPDGDRCDAGAVCGRGLCVVAGTCVAPCVDDGDCAEAERCTEVFARTGPSALQPLRACVHAADVADGVRVTRTLRMGALSGGVSPDRITLAEEAGTLLLVLEPVRASGPVEVHHLATRDDPPVVLFDSFGLFPGTVFLNPVVPYTDVPTALIPNGPLAVRSPLGYEMILAARRASDLRITSMSREGRGRTIDVDVFYVGGGSLSPAGDRGPPMVADAFTRLDGIYAPAGLAVGEVRQHEVVGGLRRRLGVIESDGDGRFPELGQLLSLSAGADGPSVPLFLVRSLDSALGIAGGIPGAAGVHGTPASGVAIGVDLLGRPGLPEDLDLGRTMAHEMGHFLGLFHTTEVDGMVIEPLPDTPTCGFDRDADGDGILLPEECAGAGAMNLLFWAAAGEALSGDQRRVIVRVPIAY